MNRNSTVAKWLRSGDLRANVLLALPIGVLAACTTSLFRLAIDLSGLLLFDSSDDITVVMAGLDWQWRVLVPSAGGSIAGLFLWWELRLPGTAVESDYMDAVSASDGRIPFRSSILRSLSSLATIVSAGSIGREGAMVQLAALSGSLAARRWANIETLRLCTACGAAAGLASVYHTPFAGALFVAEVVLGSITVDRLIPLFTATVAATLVTYMLVGEGAPLALTQAQFLWNSVDLLMLLPVGVLAGLAAPPFLSLLSASKTGFSRIPMPLLARMVLGGLLMGLVAVLVPEVCGNGYAPIVAILHGEPMSAAIIWVLIAKVAATVIIVGSGAVGGIFTPSLFIGAALGAVLANLAMHIPGMDNANGVLLALAGMAAFMAAVSHAPLMAILMVFEMTLDASLLLPLMIVCVVSYTVSSIFRSHESLYHVLRRRELQQSQMRRFETLPLGELVKPADNCLSADASWREARDMFQRVQTRYLYLLDADNNFVGALSVHKLNEVLNRHPEKGESAVRELVDTDFLVLAPEMKLAEAWKIFNRLPLGRIPVVTTEKQFLGVVSKGDLQDRAMYLSI